MLVTRPEPGASATAAQLVQLGFEPVVAPCLSIIPLSAKLPERPAAIVITSAQAIAGLPESFHKVPCFCVGDATRGENARGWVCVRGKCLGRRQKFVSAGHDASRCRHPSVGGGCERHGMALARQLRQAGVSVIRRTVYSAQPLRVLPSQVATAIAAGEIAAALFYSAETVRAFIRLQPGGTARIDALALSPAIADVLQGLPWRSIRVALAPTEADLLALLSAR